MRPSLAVALVGLMMLGSPLNGPLRAQAPAADVAGIPPQYFPPPGWCRVWMDGVPPARQPAPTDCASAEASAPPNARVVHGVTTSRRPPAVTGGEGGAPPVTSGGGSATPVTGGEGNAAATSAGGVDRRSSDEGGIDRRSPDCRLVLGDRRRTDCDWPENEREAQNRRQPSGCTDRDRDGWCDDMWLPARHPSVLPEMVGAVLVRRGQRTDDVLLWLGDVPLIVRYADANRDQMPERVVWFNRLGEPLQAWLDVDRDGRADEVGVYRAGRIVRVIQP